MTEFIQEIVSWYMEHTTYWTVALLMTIESSFIPFPSEIIVPPAAWKAAQGELSLWGVLLASSVGALLGALINYVLAASLGRSVLYRLSDTRMAHALLINRSNLEKAEQYFRDHGRSSTFIGRLVPAIRQLISLPAGIAKLDLKVFVIFTALGATLWNSVLTAIGYFLYSQKELLEKYYGILSLAGALCGVLFIAYLIYNGLKKS